MYIVIGIIGLILVISLFVKNNKLNSNEAKKNIQLAYKFIDELCKEKGDYIRNSTIQKIIKKYNEVYNFFQNYPYSDIRRKDKLVDEFLIYFGNLKEEVKMYNEEYVRKKLLENTEYFNNIDGRSLDEQQRRAVLVDEDNNLIIAGAGSGKTLTISAKVKYLVEKKNVLPANILLISFTKKSADEMKERIHEKMKIQIEAMTFHKLGLGIISDQMGERPDISDELGNVIKEYFKSDIYNSEKQLKNIIIYFSAYMNIPPSIEKVEVLGDIIKSNQKIKLTTLKDEYNNCKNDNRKIYLEKQKSKLIYLNDVVEIKPDINLDKLKKDRKHLIEEIKNVEEELKGIKLTLNGEKVKSIEEVMIANFLFINSISYEYEKAYPIKYTDGDKYKKTYHPDFYLPEYDLYIEHFGINRDGKTPWLSEIEEKKYTEGIEWKRNLHSINNTKLIETYSYYNQEGTLLSSLEKKLKENNVKFKEVDYKDIYKVILENSNNKYFIDFKQLISTFIGLFKSRGFDQKYFESLYEKINKIENDFHRERNKLFMNIVEPIYIKYQEYLKENNKIDFNDMINNASEIVRKENLNLNYKYIIIDEYQDISESRFNLIKNIRDNCDARIMCVGDDWQSIYRFSGSDVNLLYKFEKFFGKTEQLMIEKTYRNSQELIDICGNFVMRNKDQIVKQLSSSKSMEDPIKIINYDDEGLGLEISKVIDNIVLEFGEEASITILGRNNRDIEILKDSDNAKLFLIKSNTSGQIKVIYKKHKKANIKFMTVHKSKGLEDDNVIVINLTNNQYGFPNQVSDDPVLQLVLIEPEKYEYAEERRLLYVALTRTRNRVYLMAPIMNQSIFCDELKKDFKLKNYNTAVGKKVEQQAKCPRCITGYLLNRKNQKGSRFVGCSNYPYCDLTFNDVRVISDKVICPSCGGYMIRRKGNYGPFFGCTNYPHCKRTLDIRG